LFITSSVQLVWDARPEISPRVLAPVDLRQVDLAIEPAAGVSLGLTVMPEADAPSRLLKNAPCI